jgi:hypothetical protein
MKDESNKSSERSLVVLEEALRRSSVVGWRQTSGNLILRREY